MVSMNLTVQWSQLLEINKIAMHFFSQESIPGSRKDEG